PRLAVPRLCGVLCRQLFLLDRTKQKEVTRAPVPDSGSGAFLEHFNFEKGETRGGGTAPPGPN
ncbi:hypothetical protein QUW15_13470, partial [Desulfovibrio piger]|nr:hypothetical protein [Desulfovibrio piger]